MTFRSMRSCRCGCLCSPCCHDVDGVVIWSVPQPHATWIKRSRIALSVHTIGCPIRNVFVRLLLTCRPTAQPIAAPCWHHHRFQNLHAVIATSAAGADCRKPIVFSTSTAFIECENRYRVVLRIGPSDAPGKFLIQYNYTTFILMVEDIC